MALSLAKFCDYKKEGLLRVNLIDKVKTTVHWSLWGGRYKTASGWKKIPADWTKLSEFEDQNIKFININDFPEFKDDSELKEPSVQDLNNLVGEAVVKIVQKKLTNCIIWKYSEKNLLPG